MDIKKYLAVLLAAAEFGTVSAFADDIDTLNIDDDICLYEVVAEDDIPSSVYIQSIYADFNVESQNQTIADVIDNAVKNYRDAKTIDGKLYLCADISEFGISVDSSEISSLIQSVVYDNPEYFYANCTRYQYYYNPATNLITELLIPLRYDIDEIESRTEEFKKAADAVVETIQSQAETDFDRILMAHDYIAQNCEYDVESSKISTMTGHGADDVFIRGMAVCQGYASAYRYLLEQMGIECQNAYDEVDGHEWSIVKLNGKYYHVDVTHDDSTPDRLGSVYHNYFLLTDAEIVVTNSHSMWDKQGTYVCDDTTYSDLTLHNAVTAVIYDGDDRYYGAAYTTKPYKTGIYKSDSDFSSANPLFEFVKNGRLNGSLGLNLWSYVGIYSGLGLLNGELYFNSADALCKYNISTGKITEIYKPDFSDSGNSGQIFASMLKDGVIYYAEGVITTSDTGTYISTADVMTYSIESSDTPTATPEASPETSPEATPEASPEVTPTATPEASPVATAKATPVVLENEITEQSNTLHVDESGEDSQLVGEISVEITETAKKDDTIVYVGIYENDILKQIILRTLSEFDSNNIFDVSVEYDETMEYTYKIFAWGDGIIPYSLPLSGAFKDSE